MRISRRTSGGRGEYEISEAFQDITPMHLLERRLVLDYGDWLLDTGTELRLQGGKRRVRLVAGTIHLHRQIAATLLMPRPVRSEAGLGRGQPILKSSRYAIEHFSLDGVRLSGDDEAILRVGDIELRNLDLHGEVIAFPQRLGSIQQIWANADMLPRDLSILIHEHRDLVTAGAPLPKHGEELVSIIEELLTEMGGDFGIYRQGGEDVVLDLMRTIELAVQPPEPPIRVEEVDPEEVEIKRRVTREWKRWAAARGAASARFRAAVRDAYRWTCLACGAHYPRTQFNRIAGVEAAHILPWADYDLDHVSNGICLCRTHHWAFDEGLLVLGYSEDSGQYAFAVSAEAEAIIERDHPTFSLDELRRCAGVIPETRLPDAGEHRPHPEFLQHFFDLYHRL